MDNKALYKIGYGLYILTTEDDGRDNGCVINTLMQVTSSPSLCVVGVNKQNYSHDTIFKTGKLNVSALTVDAPFEIFERFGFQSGRDVNKFEGYPNFKRADNGVLYLPEYSNSYLSLDVIEAADYGTHTLFKTVVSDAQVLSDAESVTYSYYQANIKPRPKPVKTKGWQCLICGYVYEGEELPPDFTCPICKHGAEDFVRITE